MPESVIGRDLFSAIYECIYIHSRYSKREHDSWCECRVSAADVAWDLKCYITFTVSFFSQDALYRVSNGDDPLCGLFSSVLFVHPIFEHAECKAAFHCATRLGYYAEADFVVLNNFFKVGKIVAAHIIARVKYLRAPRL